MDVLPICYWVATLLIVWYFGTELKKLHHKVDQLSSDHADSARAAQSAASTETGR